MTNADKFKNIFGLYATELWSMPEKDFLKWLNSEAVNCSEFPNNSDTISRQAAIDLIESIETERLKGNIELIYAPAIKGLRALPPAQPEQLGTDLAEVGTDCISRQSAIDAFNTNLNELVIGGEENAKTVENYLNRVLDKIKCLPSAQPEIVRCKDCDWWTKQEDSPQGRCELLQMYPTGGWFCGNARRREVTE